MSHDGRDAFYVGYQRTAPAGLGPFLRRISVGLLLLAVVMAGLLVLAQRPFSRGVFEFGVERTFEGMVVEVPYPMIWLDEGPESIDGKVAPVLTSAFGKRGAGPLLAGYDGRRVRLRGTAIYRDDQFMIEVVDGSVEEIDAATVAGPGADSAAGETSRRSGIGAAERSAAKGADLGEITVKGEIVDSKCYLGVMKPARDKPHKACAVRCISGGAPPMLIVESFEGERAYLLLVDRQGDAVGSRLLDLVAEPVLVTGRLSRLGDRFVLAADPSEFRILE